MFQTTTSLTQRVKAFREKHAKKEMAIFFLAGFLVDVFTLSRIDDTFSIIQQGVYLLVLGGLLIWDQRYELKVAEPPKFIRKIWVFAEDAIHFIFGSLLSVYSLLYLKSASGLASLAFLAVMFLLLLANELPQFRKQGSVVRFGLYSFCLTSYFAYLLPMLFGFVSKWLFLGAVVLACIPLYFFLRLLRRWKQARLPIIKRVVGPGLAVQALLLGLYLVRAIPPVPLSVQYMGIYHGVEKDGPEYMLLHQRADWKFWQHGDQEFFARPGDRLYCFVRVFAPNKFKDRVQLRWSYEDPRRGWVEWDAIPLKVSGGRGEGYRGITYKENYQPGRWRATLETDDGRDVGTIHFNVLPDAESVPRIYKVDRM